MYAIWRKGGNVQNILNRVSKARIITARRGIYCPYLIFTLFNICSLKARLQLKNAQARNKHQLGKRGKIPAQKITQADLPMAYIGRIRVTLQVRKHTWWGLGPEYGESGHYWQCAKYPFRHNRKKSIRRHISALRCATNNADLICTQYLKGFRYMGILKNHIFYFKPDHVIANRNKNGTI